MKKYKVAIVGLFAIAMGLTACRYDNVEDLYPGPTNCDTTVTGYAAFIEPMLAQQCYDCHGYTTYTNLGGGRLLEGYTALQDYVNDSTLIQSIKHDPSVVAMPQGKPQLDACTIAKVQRWINKGAQNN